MASDLYDEAWYRETPLRPSTARSEILGHNFKLGITTLISTFYYMAAGTMEDVFGALVFFAYQNRNVPSTFIGHLGPYLLILFFGIFLVAILDTWFAPRNASNTSTWKSPARPYLIPCRTSHRRLTPEKHSFSYSYLAVGIPVGYKGSANGMIAVEDKEHWRGKRTLPFRRLLGEAWYSVNASNYFQRGHNHLDLRGKLNLYLQSQGIEPTQFPYAYLITAPSVLGYQFNPVSFWYLYSPTKTLSAIIFEVNNTFGERRPYLFLRSLTEESEDSTLNQRIHMTGSRMKDFHVSPFNSRDGNYTIRASDPLGKGMEGFRGVDVTITLNSASGHPKMVARLFSDGRAVDPKTMDPSSKAVFLAKWMLVGFLTFPRIIKEAVILLIYRKLHIWERPEPLPGTLGRNPTAVERCLKNAFLDYLQFTVKECEKPVKLKFYGNALTNTPEITFTSTTESNTSVEDVLEIHTLTPAFYSRFIQYSDSLVAFSMERKENGTVLVERQELLRDLFGRKKASDGKLGAFDTFFQFLINHMRKRLSRELAGSASTSLRHNPGLSSNQGNRIQMSSIDEYMHLHVPPTTRRQYQWAMIRHIVTDCYFMGYFDALQWATNIIRIAIAWKIASMFGDIMASNP